MFKFGWLTITADDLQIWTNYPNAAFTLVRAIPDTQAEGEEFKLGTFELRTNSNYAEGGE